MDESTDDALEEERIGNVDGDECDMFKHGEEPSKEAYQELDPC